MRIVIPGLDTDSFSQDDLDALLSDLCDWADEHAICLYSDEPLEGSEPLESEDGKFMRWPIEAEDTPESLEQATISFGFTRENVEYLLTLAESLQWDEGRKLTDAQWRKCKRAILDLPPGDVESTVVFLCEAALQEEEEDKPDWHKGF